jgi:ClpP class serine protease
MKSFLDPFRPVAPEDVERLRAIQGEIHDVFIGVVKERRGQRLRGTDRELFSGAFWSGAKAHELGLIDGLADMRSKLREMHGEKVRLRVVPLGGGGLLSRLRRPSSALSLPAGWADELASTLETRALWARYGI